MPTVLSKELLSGQAVTGFLFKDNKRKAASAFILAMVLYLIKQRVQGGLGDSPTRAVRKQGRGNVDRLFFQRILTLIKIVIPSWKSKEVLDLTQLTIFLVARTMLSIYLASVNGRIVNAIIKMDFALFVKRIVTLGMIAVPASFVNSYLDFLNKRLAIHFRSRLTNYFHELYIKNMIFYQVANLDSRVSNPDQRLTSDIEKWANSLSQIYSNFSKPLLDIFLFTKKLTEYIGIQAPVCIGLWYLFSGIMLKFVSPPFGKFTAIEQKLEGHYRDVHSQLLYHAEEVAFYRGQSWEKGRINESFKGLMAHVTKMTNLRLYMGVFDGLLVKYGSVMAGYAVMGLPVFGLNKEKYLQQVGGDKTMITRDYVRNSSLLISLAKAIGRMVLSYKEIQQLAGYTKVVYEIKEVLGDLNSGKFKRVQVNKDKGENKELLKDTIKQDKQSIISLDKGKIIQTEDVIEFDRVPIVSPNGDVLVAEMCFKITPGMNVVICGPNGCGKSSLFRILGGLWPVSGGQLFRPSIEKLFYIPQRPYLPPGTLRDQIIYPHAKINMLRKKVSDQDLVKLLESVQLGYLVYREGGLDALNDWNDILSGGEKQRIAMARLFYHKPLFAILDECTSQVTVEMETIMYNTAKELGITLFTVSHRTSLFKFHEYMLKFDGEGGYQLKKINSTHQ